MSPCAGACLLAALALSMGAQTTTPQITVPQTTAPQTTAPQTTTAPAPTTQRPTTAPAPATPTRANVLLGAYGPFRANNDLLSYHLTLRVDPVTKTIAGSNLVRFRMLEDGDCIQLDLTQELAIDAVELPGREGNTTLRYVRDERALFIGFPQKLLKGQEVDLLIRYHGTPVEHGRFGDFSFSTDAAGRPWIVTSDEDDGCSTWFPCKDQWRDEPQDGTDLSISVPNGLMDVSNGRLVSSRDLHDGYTEWNWHVSYPINSYDIALNIGAYKHFSDLWKNPEHPEFATLTLDYYVLPEDLDKARAQFVQAKPMLSTYEHFLGEYPFQRDGYKLIQVPYAGMEHQSAIAYGNKFANGYFVSPDWTGVGISPRFDFIIIHESGHEWFGNSITAADRADMWIHEAWTTYLEVLFVERQYGRADAIKYTTGFVPKVFNRRPVLAERGVNQDPDRDQYFKGALMIATLRSIINDDPRWFTLLHAFYQQFKYQNILTEEVVHWWNTQLGQDLTPFFNQYLRHTAVPCLLLNFDEAHHTVMYKWQADEPGFAMPVEVGDPAHWQAVHPTLQWQTMPTTLTRDQFSVATDLFYVNVSKT